MSVKRTYTVQTILSLWCPLLIRVQAHCDCMTILPFKRVIRHSFVDTFKRYSKASYLLCNNFSSTADFLFPLHYMSLLLICILMWSYFLSRVRFVVSLCHTRCHCVWQTCRGVDSWSIHCCWRAFRNTSVNLMFLTHVTYICHSFLCDLLLQMTEM